MIISIFTIKNSIKLICHNISANRLKTAGVPAVQAEAEALSEVLEINLSELATNKDIDAKLEKTGSALRQEISDLNAKMSDMKFELLKWLIDLTAAQAGLLIGLLKFFPINS